MVSISSNVERELLIFSFLTSSISFLSSSQAERARLSQDGLPYLPHLPSSSRFRMFDRSLTLVVLVVFPPPFAASILAGRRLKVIFAETNEPAGAAKHHLQVARKLAVHVNLPASLKRTREADDGFDSKRGEWKSLIRSSESKKLLTSCHILQAD